MRRTDNVLAEIDTADSCRAAVEEGAWKGRGYPRQGVTYLRG